MSLLNDIAVEIKFEKVTLCCRAIFKYYLYDRKSAKIMPRSTPNIGAPNEGRGGNNLMLECSKRENSYWK